MSVHRRIIRVDPADHVAVALRTLSAGESINDLDRNLVARQTVPLGHKISLSAIARGEVVVKLGHPIGQATQRIEPGDLVHSHNLDALPNIAPQSIPSLSNRSPDVMGEHSFLGYVRGDGRVGTRNEIWVLCWIDRVRSIARRIATDARARFANRIDGVFAFDALDASPMPDDAARSQLAALAFHPNAGGVPIVTIAPLDLQQLFGATSGLDCSRIRLLVAQDAYDEVADGLRLVGELVDIAACDRRTQHSWRGLVVGLKCGATDGFSGLTCNPLIGRLADLVTVAGGTTILTELPEILGAVHHLMARAAAPQVAAELLAMSEDYRKYFTRRGLLAPDQPNPGNIAGGVTTLAEKALGAVQKAGHAPLTQVIRYGERVGPPGLAGLEAPGTDEVSTGALAAAGATLILFGTGNGTPWARRFPPSRSHRTRHCPSGSRTGSTSMPVPCSTAHHRRS